MIAALCIAWAFVGAFWRRAFGGFGGWSRSVLATLSILLIAPGLIWMPHWELSPLVIAAWLWLWCDGHEWTDPKAMLYRYGYPSAVIALVSGYWPVVLVGPLIAGGYWVVQRNWFRMPQWGDGFIDGDIAYAECWAGFIAVLIFNLSGGMQWL